MRLELLLNIKSGYLHLLIQSLRADYYGNEDQTEAHYLNSDLCLGLAESHHGVSHALHVAKVSLIPEQLVLRFHALCPKNKKCFSRGKNILKTLR